jgi:MFS family permease
MLPTTVALVSAAFTGSRRGTALGTMGGIAAVAGAAGPVSPYPRSAFIASSWGYAAAFLVVSLIGIGGCVLAWRAGRSRTEAPPRTAESSVDTEGRPDSPN